MWHQLLVAGLALFLAASPPIDELKAQARARKAKGDAAGALELYRQAVSAAPESADLHDEIGFLEAVLRRPAEAKAEFRKAIELDPGFAPAQFHLGVALWLEQNQTEGLAALR